MGLYQAGIFLYSLIARLMSVFNGKARQFIHGRKDLFRKLKENIPENQNVVWFHCASLGEFEQGRPLIEAWKNHYPEDFILLTFFSPSGYEIRKNNKVADYVSYLPLDSKSNARRFLNIVKPRLVFFVKYEFWLNFIDTLYRDQIPFYLVSGIFRKDQHFFKWYGKIFQQRLRKFRYFFLQNYESGKLLSSLGIDNFKVSGDTRFDRVIRIAGKAKTFHLPEIFKQDSLVLLAGSTWPPDEKLFYDHIFPQLNKKLKLIIAPHQADNVHIDQLKDQLPDDTLLWSENKHEKAPDSKVLLVDTIGILSSLYQYADIAYIGGGFGKGIHNTLEAATFGIPVVFGPNYKQFKEAVELEKQNAAFPIANAGNFKTIMNKLINNNNFREKAGTSARQYVENQTGATDIILDTIASIDSQKQDE